MLPNYSKVNGFKGVKSITPKKSNHVPPKNQRDNRSEYQKFVEEVLPNFSEDIVEKWKSKELLHYFKYYAEKNGYRYVITNYPKEMSIMSRVRDDFSNLEICAMIEFLYESEQTYLRKDTLTVNVLNSSWVNTISADTRLWVNNEYPPKKKSKREWNDSKKDIKIGEWE